MATLNFDANTVNPETTLDPVPAGFYNCSIVDSEMKASSTGGAYLQLTLQVMDGEFVGRKIFDRLNLKNANPVAQEIAYKRLSAYCHATSVIQVQDSQQLHGIPFKAKVVVREDKTGQYAPSNEVKGVQPIGQQVQSSWAAPPSPAPAQQSAAPAQPSGPAAATSGNVPPWAQ